MEEHQNGLNHALFGSNRHLFVLVGVQKKALFVWILLLHLIMLSFIGRDAAFYPLETCTCHFEGVIGFGTQFLDLGCPIPYFSGLKVTIFTEKYTR